MLFEKAGNEKSLQRKAVADQCRLIYFVNFKEESKTLLSVQQVVPVDAVLRIVLQIGGSGRTGTAQERTSHGAGCGFADNVQLRREYRNQGMQDQFMGSKIRIGGLFFILVRFSQCEDFAQIVGVGNLLSIVVNLALLFFGDFCGLEGEVAQAFFYPVRELKK